NCFKNGLLPVVLSAAIVDELFKAVASNSAYKLVVDLQQQTVTTEGRKSYAFDVDAFRKHCLINGLDDIGLTLQHADKIKVYEVKRKLAEPWLFS
ncbi:MAG: 3-isopropylmalate dehydratase small subunit, partial [Burkholderiales bacterium]